MNNTLIDGRSYSSSSIKVAIFQPNKVFAVSLDGTTHEGYTEEIIIS